MSLGSESINQIISALKTDSIEAYCTVASSALILYDHLSTFSREVEFIWGRKFNSVTMLFYFNRWINFSSAILDLFGLFPFRAIPSCKGVILTNEAMSIVRIFIWTVFSTFRIYAISGGGWLLAIVVCVLNLVPVVTNAVRVQYASIAVVVSARLCVIAADILVLLITWSKTFGMKRAADRSSVKAPLTAMLLRDGKCESSSLCMLIAT
ncbi:hypothetical protein OBBRIDRAFT_776875 [Obba rivulosa]|uniref:DUF6533 domain-containing protein n=1 Tax=Obba rivulosa TaxID=1052685 RepID=A0A8E2AYF3_9APHY|nr:hypothetical protein OBBRIDRAFT_776875 [Obba rivulosa]